MSDAATLARLDHTVIAQVRQLESIRPGVLKHLVDMFDTGTTRTLGEVDARIDAGEFEALRVAFHSLKGTAASLGAPRLSALAANVERAAAAAVEGGDRAALTAAVDAVRTEFAAVRVELAAAAGT